MKFQSTPANYYQRAESWDKELSRFKEGTPKRKAQARRIYRNRLDENNQPYGYGVLTDEKTALYYLSKGIKA